MDRWYQFSLKEIMFWVTLAAIATFEYTCERGKALLIFSTVASVVWCCAWWMTRHPNDKPPFRFVRVLCAVLIVGLAGLCIVIRAVDYEIHSAYFGPDYDRLYYRDKNEAPNLERQ